MNNIFTTTLRLNLTDDDERRAYEYLQSMDKKKYRSYSKVIVAAINDYFERQEKLAADPYLETREKEDAFLRKITKTIENAMRYVPTVALPAVPAKEENNDDNDNDNDDDNDSDEYINAALEFAIGNEE